MRRALCILVVLASCGSNERRTSAEQPGSAAAPAQAPAPADAAWARVEALAEPSRAYGPSTALERAIAISDQHDAAWFDLQVQEPSPPLSAYPQGREAVDALNAWAAARGGFPQASPPNAGLVTLDLLNLGKLVVFSASSRDDLAPAIYIGTFLVTDGRDLLDVQFGVDLLERAHDRLRTFPGPAEPFAPPPLDLVRALAANATRSVRLGEWYRSADGKKDVQPGTRVPSDRELADYKAFWTEALDGATRGEAAAITRDRLRRAADRVPASMKDSIASTLRVVDAIAASLDALRPAP